MTYEPERNSDYLKRRYAEQKTAFHAYLGDACARCGTTDDLQIDHVDPSKKSFPVSKLWPRKDLTLVYKELDKCQLLCRTHHEEKTAEEHRLSREGTFTHGTLYAWQKKKCLCEDCIAAKDAWNEERNARRRTGARGPYRKSLRGENGKHAALKRR